MLYIILHHLGTCTLAHTHACRHTHTQVHTQPYFDHVQMVSAHTARVDVTSVVRHIDLGKDVMQGIAVTNFNNK